MARLILSAGMFSALAAATAVRRRGFESAPPPAMRAAMVISLMSLVKILPRFASSAPFLCLMVAHLEWPDIGGILFGKRPACGLSIRPSGCTSVIKANLNISTTSGRNTRAAQTMRVSLRARDRQVMALVPRAFAPPEAGCCCGATMYMIARELHFDNTQH